MLKTAVEQHLTRAIFLFVLFLVQNRLAAPLFQSEIKGNGS